MGGSSRSTNTTTQQAYDNRTFKTVNNNQKIDNSVEIDNDYRYDIDNSVRNDIDYRYDIDNSKRVEDSYNTTNNVDKSTTIEDSYNTTTTNEYKLEEGSIFAHGDVTVTDGGAMLAALNFAEQFAKDQTASATQLSKLAIEEAFKSTIGGLTEQSNTTMRNLMLMGVSAAAIAAYAASRS